MIIKTAIDSKKFRSKFLFLIFNAWTVPAVFGLSFILYVNILNLSELLAVMSNPLEPIFALSWIVFSLWYFARYSRPIFAYLENTNETSMAAAMECVRKFPLHFWSLFLLYLVAAPVSVIWAAELYAGFTPRPVD